MGEALRNFHTVAEYEALVKNAAPGERYEYSHGKIIPFTDEYTSDDHNQVVQNAADILKAHFYPQGCRVYTENVRLVVDSLDEHRLPDVMVTCSERDKYSKDAKREPVILAEVLSPSTSFTDLVEKAEIYKAISTLQAYLIINPAKIWVRIYQRNGNREWLPPGDVQDVKETVHLPQIPLSIPVSELYRFVL